jgi:uncharacterized membrane protein YfcA
VFPVEPSSPLAWLALTLTGVAAGYLNVVAGGGSLLTVPLLIFLGLPDTIANGTSRIAIFVQNGTATLAYARAGKLDRALLKQLTLPALVGAGGGAALASSMPDAMFRDVLAWAMLGCAALVALPSRALTRDAAGEEAPRLGALRVWPVMLAIGFYGGLIQAGVGYLFLALLGFVLRLRLLDANIMKVAVVFAYTPIALAFFLAEDKIAWEEGLVLSIGQAAGGFLGVRAALSRGESFIRAALALTVLGSALKLLLD